MSNISRPLLPFSYDQSRPEREIALATRLSRKRDYPTSESILEVEDSTDIDDNFDSHDNKRIQLYSEAEGEDLWVSLPSSPPRTESLGFTSSTCRPLSTLTETNGRDVNGKSASAISGRSSSFVVVDKKSLCAIDIIRAAVEDGKADIDLDSLDVSEIPDDIADLKNLVSLVSGFNGCNDTGPLQPDVRIYLSNNRIERIPPSLLEVDNITVLSLRNNLLKEIPNSIARLRNLKNLSLGGNNLRYLPAQILDLRHLQVLAVHPNPLEPLPIISRTDGKAVVKVATSSKSFSSNSFGISLTSSFNNTYVPTLSEICLRILSGYNASDKEINKWNLASNINKMISTSREMYTLQNSCGQCGRFLVKEVGYAYEWWNSIAGVNGLVLRRDFCCGRCIDQWDIDQCSVVKVEM
ncbi:hypothetical protein V1511DRAFT_455050 [Dipodascopsis uninucleata]